MVDMALMVVIIVVEVVWSVKHKRSLKLKQFIYT